MPQRAWSAKRERQYKHIKSGLRKRGASEGRAEEVATMPQRAWSSKRERQYEHIKEAEQKQGASTKKAKEIAARTVNKERARTGEARRSSRLSRTDISSGRRGGLRSHTGARGRTRDQLYEEAKDHGIRGRSKMNKAQLQQAVDRRK